TLDLDNHLPAEFPGLLNQVQLGLRTAVEHRVKPVIAPEPLGGLVLVGGQADLSHSGTSFHFDEPDLDGRPRVLGVGPTRDQVEASVLALDALDLPSSRFLMAN